ncbi:hypothetical protein AAHA92_21788 [Salvia divinorum]|uniref:Uncharacterized protein n=1 Tax=Salvia divinorum TaxID=28513 RepID=A0ABD1GLX3_SALDI
MKGKREVVSEVLIPISNQIITTRNESDQEHNVIRPTISYYEGVRKEYTCPELAHNGGESSAAETEVVSYGAEGTGDGMATRCQTGVDARLGEATRCGAADDAANQRIRI